MNNKLYKLMNWPMIEEIIYSESDHPQDILGPHAVGGHTLYQAYFPQAVRAELRISGKETLKKMEMTDEAGFFAALVPGKAADSYAYLVTWEDGSKTEVLDAYAKYPSLFTGRDLEKFRAGIHYTIYEKLGAHPVCLNGMRGVHFALWAPHALRVSVVGDFNDWDGRVHQMIRRGDSGIFELFVPKAEKGQNYKFELKLKNGLTYLKADPYANAAQLRPDNASVIADLGEFVWEDEKWMEQRGSIQSKNSPVSVYELYLGSFARKESGNAEDGSVYLNYRELAGKIIGYVKSMGYTHVELMPVMEHPLDASWGYQTLGYYAPTARYGTPEDFMCFVNELHKAGIGVILDWVPAHFPKDDYGLSNFDGTCLYEHLDKRKGEHPHWGTLIFNYGRPQVSNFLIANALFWVEKYHADGIRMDAVASMLYLDYGRNEGEWIPNIYGGNENLEAVELIKHLNSILHKRNPGVITVAEESTAWPMVTGSLDQGGLGFDMKWNMGFMNDFLDYMRYDPYFRSYHQDELTFSMIYAYSENFMLVFSHDEVVHGKASMLGKMPGSREDKFANLRLVYGFMMAHPGKKLLFMGQDLGEFDEWNERRSVEWGLAQYPEHKGIQNLVKALNELYRSKPALYVNDTCTEGFEWINCIDSQKCCVSFLRKGTKKEDLLVIVANFAGVEQNLQVGVPLDGRYKEILNTADKKYGGNRSAAGRRPKTAVSGRCDERDFSIKVTMPPLALSVFEFME